MNDIQDTTQTATQTATVLPAKRGRKADPEAAARRAAANANKIFKRQTDVAGLFNLELNGQIIGTAQVVNHSKTQRTWTLVVNGQTYEKQQSVKKGLAALNLTVSE